MNNALNADGSVDTNIWSYNQGSFIGTSFFFFCSSVFAWKAFTFLISTLLATGALLHRIAQNEDALMAAVSCFNASIAIFGDGTWYF